jgi:hypothetical protein
LNRTESEPLILIYLQDPYDMVRVEALRSLALINPAAAESHASCEWDRADGPNKTGVRVSILLVLSRIKSRELPKYLQLAQAEKNHILQQTVKNIESYGD